MRLSQITAAVAVLGMVAGAAQANVVYNWMPTSAGEYVASTGGQLVFSDAAYRQGSVAFNAQRLPMGGAYGDQVINSPVLHAFMSFDYPSTTYNVDPTAEGFGSGAKNILGNFVFSDDGYLSGAMSMFAESDEFAASGSGDHWSITDLGSDYFSGEDHCVGYTLCDAGTGYWQRQANDVPEPGSWAMLLLGGLGALSLAWRRRRSV